MIKRSILLILLLSQNILAEDPIMMSIPSPSTDSCEGLAFGEIDRMDDDIGDPLYQVPQVNDQESVTNGVGFQDTHGNYFGSCATFTSIARIISIFNKENVPIPSDFELTEDNIRRFFKDYGDGFNIGKGIGNAQIVSANILNEYKQKHCQGNNSHKKLKQCRPSIIDKYLMNPQENRQLRQKLRVQEMRISQGLEDDEQVSDSLERIFLGISEEFNKKSRWPIEIIHGGNALNSTQEGRYPPIYARQRFSHVSLITGRRLTQSGVCELLIRNSYQTRCFPRVGVGRHVMTGRECEGETDSTWFTESHVKRFIGSVKMTHPRQVKKAKIN